LDAIHLAVALVPLSAYLLRQGWVNLRRRPVVSSGFRDATFLALGVSGCVIAGPLELFYPETASYRFGPWTWLLLIGMYVLVVTLIVLLMRPRVVIYNVDRSMVLPVLHQVTQQMDPQSIWAGDGADCPRMGVQFHMEDHVWLRNVQLIANGPSQNFDGWKALESVLRRELRSVAVRPSSAGVGLTAIAFALLVSVGAAFTAHQGTLMASLRQMLRIY
jgi:hypothetical protein